MRVETNPANAMLNNLIGLNTNNNTRKPNEDEAEKLYTSQTKESAEERRMMRSENGFRREDRNGVTIGSKQGDTAEISYTALNLQKSEGAIVQ
jgi:hypothetical protein